MDMAKMHPEIIVASLAVGRVSVFPLLHRLSRDRSRRCLAVKARRAVSSPEAAGRPNPLRLFP